MSALQTIAFLHTLGQVKETPRTGWVENGVPKVESVGDHMYRMAFLCMMCPDTTLDKNRMIRMALCHDMAESVVGDISPAMKVPKEEKYARELAALNDMTALLTPEQGSDEFKALWHEYEAQETPESHFVRDMDLLEMIVQAHRYEATTDRDLAGFYDSGFKIKHPWARQIFDQLRTTRPAGRSPVEPAASA